MSGLLDGPVAWINCEAVRTNLKLIAKQVAPAGLCPVVKADAYGHGLDQVLDTVLAAKPRMLAVATVEEAAAVRPRSGGVPILVFRPMLPDESVDVAALLKSNVRLSLLDLTGAEALSAAAKRRGAKLPVHFKIDTGMGRMGVLHTQAASVLKKVARLPGLRLEGLYTHLATADELDSTAAEEQLDHFDTVIKAARVDASLIHAANSAAALALPRSRYGMVRCGLAIYGVSPGPAVDALKLPLRPALKLQARLCSLKQLPAGHAVGYGRAFITKAATPVGIVPIGYADGYLRSYSNKAVMLRGNVTAPVIGRVSMDQTAVDLSAAEDARLGDVMTVIDDVAGSPASASALAAAAGTIGYEVLSRLGPRIRRAPAPCELEA